MLGIGVFTAAPGMGKSYCLRCFEDSLNENLYDMRYICLSTVSVGEFYKLLCEELGLETKGGKTIMFKAIQDRITYLYKEKKQPRNKRKLLGAVDPVTGEIVPTSRKRKAPSSGQDYQKLYEKSLDEIEKLHSRIAGLEAQLSGLLAENKRLSGKVEKAAAILGK